MSVLLCFNLLQIICSFTAYLLFYQDFVGVINICFVSGWEVFPWCFDRYKGMWLASPERAGLQTHEHWLLVLLGSGLQTCQRRFSQVLNYVLRSFACLHTQMQALVLFCVSLLTSNNYLSCTPHHAVACSPSGSWLDICFSISSFTFNSG